MNGPTAYIKCAKCGGMHPVGKGCPVVQWAQLSEEGPRICLECGGDESEHAPECPHFNKEKPNG